MPDIDYSAAKFWFDFMQTVFMAIVTLYVWINNKHRATKESITQTEARLEQKLDALDGRVDEHNDRLLGVEREIHHLPSVKDIHEVHARVDQVGQGVKSMEGEMKQINSTLQLIQQHLLTEASR